jgi:K+-transporting ATPase ATPase C chain
MLAQFKPAVILFVLLTAITGVIYPLTITGIAQVLFPGQANGSLIVVQNQTRGSTLIGQPFDDPQYFWGRLSATSPFPYNAAASSGSNLGPLNPDLARAARVRIAALKVVDPHNTQPIPVDLVAASASGLDPHISIAAALYQVPRVARARGLNEARVRSLVEQFTADRQFSVLGEPRVNVLLLNFALDVVK